MTFREALKQKKLSEIRNDFINNMTHEFKTPIATISLAADTVMNEAVIHDAESVKKYAELIKRENRRMNEQVEKVLELALTERNELEVVKENIDLNELLVRLVNVMALQINAKNGKIISLLSTEKLFINGDSFHLERVFLNLLDNAIKYSKDAPEITVKSFEKDNSIIVEISDRGIGIAAEEQERIFDRFYRVPTGNLHNVKGFGLGLSYVQAIVEKHNGKIEVESKPGTGSTFRIIFKK
jgi:two-component system phosphate regulon sensor histidine kinase PhoR